MGAKKKGKGSKLARMSEEERLRYLQHRAAIEEEARRRKEQLIATFMKNKLKREEDFSRLNVAKINQQWRQTLRKYKCVELRQDLEALFKWFVHTASKKTKQIDMLLDDLDEAERQYSRIHECHMEIVNRLLDIHRQRTDFFKRQYEEERKEIYEKATKEMDTIVSSFVFDQDHLKSIIFRIQESHKGKIAAMEAKHTARTDELRNNMLTELESLVLSRESRIEQLWQNIQTVLKDHWEATEDRRRQYITLRDADLNNCRQIFFFYQQINNANETIICLKDQLLKAKITSEEKFEEMKREKDEYNELFNVLRKQFDIDREKDRRSLKFLTTRADSAAQNLTKIHQKGEQIMQLWSLCKKLEVLRDKIYPFMADKCYLNEEQEKLIVEEEGKFQEKLAEDVVKNFSKLNNFWKKYNQVLIEKEALVLNIKSLEIEQKELKSALKNYLSEAMFGKSSGKIRIMVNRPFTSDVRQPAIRAQQGTFSRVPYVEATHSPSIRHMIRVLSGK